MEIAPRRGRLPASRIARNRNSGLTSIAGDHLLDACIETARCVPVRRSKYGISESMSAVGDRTPERAAREVLGDAAGARLVLIRLRDDR